MDAPLLISFNQDTWRSGHSYEVELMSEACAKVVQEMRIHTSDREPTPEELAQYIAFVVHNLLHPGLFTDGVASYHSTDWYSKFVRRAIRGEREESVCIYGQCFITMADGCCKRAVDICPGEMVATSSGHAARVECTLHQSTGSADVNMCEVAYGCIITPEHPYRFANAANEWLTPAKMVDTTPMVVNVVQFCTGVRCMLSGDWRCGVHYIRS